MGFNGVQVNKLSGGLGTTAPGTDNVNMLIVVVPLLSLPAGVNHWEATKCLLLDDVDNLGFDAAFDANEKLLINHQAKMYFKYAPTAPLYIMAVPDAITIKAIFEDAKFRLAFKNNSEIKGIGLIGTSEDFLTVDAVIPDVQAVINSLASEQLRIDYVVLEGKGTAVVTPLANFTDKRALNAANVSVAIGQDPAVAALDAAYAKYADVGSVLGMLAQRKVNENLGSIDIANKPNERSGEENYTLTYGGSWLGAALSDGQDVTTFTDTQLKALTAKGYIFACDYNEYSGIYFNSSPTCVLVTSDYSYVENNRTWNKAARIIRRVLLPKVKGVVPKDPITGFARPTIIASWKNQVERAIEREMIEPEEISGFDINIPYNQFPDENTPLKANARVVKDGIVHEFVVNVGLVNNL